jgi:alpha-1,6-mannosyltransferase
VKGKEESSSFPKSRRGALAVIAGLGLAQLLLYLRLLLIKDFAADILGYLTIYFGIFLIYFAASLLSPKMVSRSPENCVKYALVFVLAFSVFFRVLMLFTSPTLSSDILRFAWDGRVFSHGIDPYAFKPSSVALDWLKKVPYFDAYDHKEEITPYPPVAQFIFLIGGLISGSLLGFKVISTVLDIANCLILAYLLKEALPNNLIGGFLLYSWSPLVVLEFSSSGHIDSLPIFFLLLSLIFLYRSHLLSSAFSFSLAVWSKIYPIFFLPIYLQNLRLRKRQLTGSRYLVTFFLVSSGLLAPFLISSGFNLFLGQLHYASAWFYNPSVFLLLNLSLTAPLAKAGLNGLFLRILLGLVFLALSVRFIYSKPPRSLSELAYSSILVLGLSLLLASAVFPWYLSWILIFCAMVGLNWKTLPWIILSATVNLSYLLQFFKEVNIIHVALAEYLPVYVTLIIAYALPYVQTRLHREF